MNKDQIAQMLKEARGCGSCDDARNGHALAGHRRRPVATTTVCHIEPETGAEEC